MTKYAVEGGDVDIVLRFGFHARHAHQCAARQDGREKGDVSICGAFDGKTRLGDSFAYLLSSVADAVMRDVVLHAPQPHKRRHEKQPVTARFQHTPHLAQAGHIVVQVFHHVQRRHQSKLAVGVRQLFRQPFFNLCQPPRAAKFQRVVGNIHTMRVAKLRQHLQIRARAATHIQNLGGWGLGVGGWEYLPEKTLQNAPPSGKPPMLALHAVHYRVGMLLHRLG